MPKHIDPAEIKRLPNEEIIKRNRVSDKVWYKVNRLTIDEIEEIVRSWPRKNVTLPELRDYIIDKILKELGEEKEYLTKHVIINTRYLLSNRLLNLVRSGKVVMEDFGKYRPGEKPSSPTTKHVYIHKDNYK